MTLHPLQSKAIVFDLDGTLIDTTPLVIAHWQEFATEHGLDSEKILATSHGRRTIETIEQWAPSMDVAATADQFERTLASKKEGVSILPGVCALLEKIPENLYAICTAGTYHMASTRLRQCNIAQPRVMITAEDVIKGKPDPAGYLMAAKGLGMDPGDCIVFEDAPAGVRAATVAGMQCIACTTTHSAEELKEAGALHVVQFLSDIDLTVFSDKTIEINIRNTL
ncbi:HAD-like domain-containing protein [Spinellus fusiger]|nr:HAD-like domain-containing protein [Spinellus fusiger]